ncbi:MAG: glycosyltransferase family 2 protein, partial [Ignavibacteria bacterium]|nr:glycosyltransferase family 2 protein [Ignavibacteria bacterium]
RLFNKQKGHWGGQNPHDKFICNDRSLVPARLAGDILHYSYYAVEEHYRQANNFAAIAAKALFEKGKRSSKPYAAMKSAVKFFRNYIFKAGFLDGRKGFIICKISALETWWKYTRLISLNQKAKK